MRKIIVCLLCTAVLVSLSGRSEGQKTTPDDLASYEFYILPYPGDRPADNFFSSRLWAEKPARWGDLTLEAEKQYIVGVEREATSKDNAITDFSFTMPKGLTLQSPVLKKSFSTNGSSLYDYGVFFPATQADVVWDGVVRWVWDVGLRLEPLAGAESITFGSHAAKPDPFLQPLISPIVRGTEMEIQVVVQDHKATKVRKIFRLSGKDVKNTQFGMLMLNEAKRDEFPSRFTVVTSAEQTHPDIEIMIAAGSTVKKKINFVHSESIWSSFMSCATRHNAPQFADLTTSFDGWNGATVKLSTEVKVKQDAPKGNHYFRMIHRASWDKGIIYKERVVKLTIQ